LIEGLLQECQRAAHEIDIQRLCTGPKNGHDVFHVLRSVREDLHDDEILGTGNWNLNSTIITELRSLEEELLDTGARKNDIQGNPGRGVEDRENARSLDEVFSLDTHGEAGSCESMNELLGAPVSEVDRDIDIGGEPLGPVKYGGLGTEEIPAHAELLKRRSERGEELSEP
jgi:hypothetical protein